MRIKMEEAGWNSFYYSLLGWLCWACQEHPWWKEQLKHGSAVSVVIILGGFSPWEHCSGVQIFHICLQSWVIGCHNIPPISHCQLLPENAPTECSLWVWKSHCQCSSCLFPELLRIFVLQELWSWKESSTQHSCEGIDLPLPGEAKLAHFGIDLIPGGCSQIGGATKNSCSDWDGGIGQWQEITRIKAVSLTKWWLKEVKKM